MQRYLDDYEAVVKAVYEAEDSVSPELNDAYFAMIEYPVCAARAHAIKILEAQRARQLANGRPGRNKEEQEEGMRIACAKAQKAYHDIVGLQMGEYNGYAPARPSSLRGSCPPHASVRRDYGRGTQ